MSTSQLSSCVNESNIPLPQRVLAESRKSKGSTHLPELRKYINTIIKASNECDVISEPDREKFRKEKKFGRYSMFKGYNNKIKYEKIRVDMNSSRRKNMNKPSTPTQEGLIADDTTTSSAFVSGFEDPRNWKFNKIQNSTFSLKVERFLKELYPNPYHLESLSEFYDLKNVQNDTTVEDMLMDDITTQDISKSEEKTENSDSITAVVEINPNNMENNFENPERLTNLEDFLQTQRTESDNTETVESLSPPPEPNSVPRQLPGRSNFQNVQSHKSSSLESVISNVESVHNMIKRTNVKLERASREMFDRNSIEMLSRNSKEILERVKSKLSTAIFAHEDGTDSGIGRVKLLNRTDVEPAVPRKMKEPKNKNSETDVSPKTTHSKIYEEEFNDLRKIHDVINKANKSFLLISEKTQGLAADIPEKIVKGEYFPEISKVSAKEVKSDVRNPKSDEHGKYVVLRNDHEAVGGVRPKIHHEGSSKASVRVSCLAQRDHPNFKNEPGRSREGEILSQTRELQKPILNNPTKQSLNNAEQRLKESIKSEDANTSQKIGEVLEFMYDCLMKFSSSEELMPEEGCNSSLVRRIFSTNQIVQPTTSKLPDETESMLRKNTPQHCQQIFSGLIGETAKKRSKMRSRRSDYALQSSKQEEVSPSANANVDCQPRMCMTSEANNENFIPTVETQNELGGYAEVTREDHYPHESLRFPKPVFPLPGKLNKSRTDARSLREVLETEEKLFARDFGLKERIENMRPKEFVTSKMGDECRISDTPSTYSLAGGIKCPNSNFVICVNSLPRNLKTFTAVTPVIAVPKCPPIPLVGVKEQRDLRPMICKSEFCLKHFCAPLETSYQVLTCTYRLKQGSVFKMNKLAVEYIAVPVCEKIVSSTFALESESSLKNSECFVRISMKSLNKPPKFGKISRSSLTIPNMPVILSSSDSGVNYESEDERRVESIVEAIEDAEGRILLLQQINESSMSINRNAAGSYGASQATENESLESEQRSKTEKKKVHDLLMRTYNLQIKLQECLNKITRLHPSLQTGPINSEESSTNVNVLVNDKPSVSETSITEIESNEKQNNSLPLVHWYPVVQPQQQHEDPTEARSPMVDHSTSYNPPTEKNKTVCKEAKESQKKETEKAGPNNEDDSSSVGSFKSSNEFSEEIDIKKETRSPENLTTRDFYKKVYNEIELIRHIFEAENRQKEQSKQVVKDTSVEEEQNNNTLVRYDTKAPSKTLKTVFRGRESSTELTIGLKDIPMTQVKNISVEKTKLTPNHTKISICISKDKSSDIRMRTVNSEIMHNKFSPYCYKDLGRSLKGTPSEEDDIISKSSRSLIEESDEDEDDYKSVASTLDESDVEMTPPKPEPKEIKVAKTPLPKKIPKHRFEFYKKMNTNGEESGSKPKALPSSVCKFKELEPLKQAMTEMQIRMRSIKRDALFNGNDYYERALKLAKMSAGYCQSCGNRAVIPNDTFGYYKSLVPRRCSSRGIRHYKASVSSDPSFYSFHSSNADVGEHICDFDIKHNSYLLNRTTHSNRTILRGSLHDMPVLFERM